MYKNNTILNNGDEYDVIVDILRNISEKDVTLPYTMQKPQLARYIGVSTDTIDDWEKAGIIPPAIEPPKSSGKDTKKGRHIKLYKVAETREWLTRY